MEEWVPIARQAARTLPGSAAIAKTRGRTGIAGHPASRRCLLDHKAYYPGAHQLHLRLTGDRQTGRLLGAQLLGHQDAEVAKRIDIPAGALFHHMTVDGLSDLDLSYTPPFGSPWDAIQLAAHDWVRQARALPA